MVGLISAEGGNQSPIAWERVRSQAVVAIRLKLRRIATETYIKLRKVLSITVFGLKPLQFLVFCDAILILRKQTASISWQIINIFANVLPIKSPQRHSPIPEFAEWE